MSSKSTRTPTDHAVALLSIFLPGGVSEQVTSRMNNKPVLVFYDDAYYNGSNNFLNERIKLEPARTAYLNGRQFIQRPELKKLAQKGTLALNEWQVKPDLNAQ